MGCHDLRGDGWSQSGAVVLCGVAGGCGGPKGLEGCKGTSGHRGQGLHGQEDGNERIQPGSRISPEQAGAVGMRGALPQRPCAGAGWAGVTLLLLLRSRSGFVLEQPGHGAGVTALPPSRSPLQRGCRGGQEAGRGQSPGSGPQQPQGRSMARRRRPRQRGWKQRTRKGFGSQRGCCLETGWAPAAGGRR